MEQRPRDIGIFIDYDGTTKRKEGLPGKEKSQGLSMIKERIDIINHSLGNQVAAFTLTEKTAAGQSGVIATLILPAFPLSRVAQEHNNIIPYMLI